MIDYKYADLFSDDSIPKQLIIEYDSTVITNEDLFDQTMTLEESLCSEEELRFGSCEASSIQFKVANIVSPMMNKLITVKMVLEGNADEPFIIGRYKVDEDKVTADRQWREVVAYDAMYDIINADMAAWYNTILPNENIKITLKQFRESFIRYFGLTEVVPVGGLVNDNMIVKKTIDIVVSSESGSSASQVSVMGETLSGLDVITSICEINGCFGHIGRDGKFHYIYLSQAIQGLYPANNLFPDHAPDYLPYQRRTGHLYPQDPKTTKLGADGTYISCHYEDYLCDTIDKLQVRQEENDIGVIVGRTGDNCYIIQDNFLVYGKGSDELWQIANNVFSKITDVVYRPFDLDMRGNPCFEVGDPVKVVTKYEIVESYILQRTLNGIQALRDAFSSQGTEFYEEKVNGVHQSIVALKGKSNTLTRNIEETRSELRDTAAGLRTQITQNANSITLEATRAKGEEEKLSARITVNANQILLRVVKGTISSEISQEAGKIAIMANRISIQSDYFTLAEDGHIASTGGTIGGWTITSTKIYGGGEDGTGVAAMQYPRGSITWVFAAGGSSHSSYKDCPFRVSKTGELYATNCHIDGDGTFSGDLRAAGGTFSGELKAATGTFKGELKAASGSFKGDVTATSGSFKSVTINGCTFQSNTQTGTLSGGTYSGGTISGGTLSGSTGGTYVGNCSGSTLSSCSTGGTTLTLAKGSLTTHSGYSMLSAGGSILYIQTGNALSAFNSGNFSVPGDIDCDGDKNRTIHTKNFGSRQLSAYETPLPTFSDYGKARLDEYGECFISIDPIFAETVNSDYEPTIFLTKYGQGDIWVDDERTTHDIAVICGTPGLKFSWETRYMQKNCYAGRMKVKGFNQTDVDVLDYGLEADIEIERNSLDYENEAFEYLELFNKQSVDYADEAFNYFTNFERSLTA